MKLFRLIDAYQYFYQPFLLNVLHAQTSFSFLCSFHSYLPQQGRWDSNSQPTVLETVALPIRATPLSYCSFSNLLDERLRPNTKNIIDNIPSNVNNIIFVLLLVVVFTFLSNDDITFEAKSVGISTSFLNSFSHIFEVTIFPTSPLFHK